MILIVCVSKDNGMLFNSRRVSSDFVVIKDIKDMLGEREVYINEYSKPLFDSLDIKTIVMNELSNVPKNKFCFIENIPAEQLTAKFEKIILYNWNRAYPADLFFNINLKKGYQKIFETIFIGNSHDKITKTIYESEDTI